MSNVNGNYRSINVDALDEDQFLDDEELSKVTPKVDEEGDMTGAAQITNVKNVSIRSLSELSSLLESKTNTVKSHMAKNEILPALALLLDNPPCGKEDQSAKERNLKLIMDALTSAKANDIPGLVKQLTSPQVDLLMKFIYRGMQSPELFNSAILLQWHEKVFEVGGYGSIVRVMTDRNTV
jgi:actin related protein 2/3 complex subunit 5